MRNTEFYFATNYCWENGIFIVVKPVNNNGQYRLAISRNGKEKIGHQVYKDKSTIKMINNIVAYGTQKNTTERVPAVDEKIKELYIDIFRKNINNHEVQIEVLKTTG